MKTSWTPRHGHNAQSTFLSAILANIANASTTGYKTRTQFSSLVDQALPTIFLGCGVTTTFISGDQRARQRLVGRP